ncbi:hypothetical protein C8A00DRAFT_47684 [Chaetomidium leptoderma]|uniref:Zn(2)-C6 fungal-type domain-containing protein n=1 Tax=Chaetomidium leptoderma TaxID=669021 RepID=A0AAN6ZSI1_9PEZI|nr:hypothetical protein C8A00DRAFT_47684 [Chaetomidium leptoderma]
MPRSDSFTCFSAFNSGSGILKAPRRERPQQLACDRCRGQKLRCIRTPNPNASCERPKRTDKEQRESTGSSYNPLSHSPTLPTSAQTGSGGGFSPSTDTWSGHDLNDTVDPTLGGVQYLEPFDFALQDATLQGDTLDIPADHYLNPTLDLSLDQSMPDLTDPGAAIDTASVHAYSRFPPMRHESTRELSNLNVELYRQLGAVGPMASKYSTIHPSLITPPDGNHTLSDAVVFMMNGLQTYHRLLVEILGLTGPPPHDAMYPHDHPKSRTSIGLLSPVDVRDCDDPMSEAVGRQQQQQARKTNPSDRELNTQQQQQQQQQHDSSSHNATAAAAAAHLDMPTSLLLLSCHTNLVYLCRDVFAAIRAALLAPATHRQLNLFTFSFLHVDEVSIPHDPDLQIIVLTEAVIRLIDRIERSLGYPDDCEVDSGGGGAMPYLPDFLMWC